MKVHLADPMAERWYDHDWDSLAEIECLKLGKLKPGAVVFDLGAHQAIVALMILAEVRPGGHVVAVEASAHNHRVAKINSKLNDADGLTVLHAAVADKPGTVLISEQLNGQIVNGSNEWGQVKVDAITIDGLSKRYGYPDVIFIDIEGFEHKALEGAKETLSHGPDVFVEVHIGVGLEKFGGSADGIISYFPEAKYELYVIDNQTRDRAVAIHDASPATFQSRFYLLARHR